MEMGSAIEQLQRNGNALQESIESSTASVHEMGASIRHVAESAETVEQVAEETAAAIVQMDRSIQEVGEHARGASELTEQVSHSASEGARAVGETIAGIAEIRDLTRDAKHALEGLARRIGEIGEIATVIGGISDETNLLSLNAAIIAAQAGEHGAAFAVVADQVKTLARRTTESTQQIERLIESVQGESANAVRAMAAGIDAVEQGVTRSRGAGEALALIRTSAGEASERVAEIARATDAQGRNSKHVAEAARRTSEQVQQISNAIAAQTQASDQILQNVDVAVEMCRQMSRATEEQNSSSRYIRSNVEAVTEMIRSIQRNTRSHEKASEQVAETFEVILDNARRSGAHLPEVMAAVGQLRDQAEAMRAEVARFESVSESHGDGAQSTRSPSSAAHRPA
jgi:methyl-accepting chemotaxis protein